MERRLSIMCVCGLDRGTYLGFTLLAGRCGPRGMGSGLFPSLVLGCPASLTNLFRTLVVKPSSRSAIRRHKWTSSTTLVRRALIVRSRSTREAITSFSLAPKAKDCIRVILYIEDCGSTCLPSVETSLLTGCGRMFSQAHALGSHWVGDHPRPGAADSLKH